MPPSAPVSFFHRTHARIHCCTRDMPNLQPLNTAPGPGPLPALPGSSTNPLPDANADGGSKKRRRHHFRRTKTGCRTCRNRKKKCDEAKPECGNCTRGRLLCQWQGEPTKILKPTPASVIASRIEPSIEPSTESSIEPSIERQVQSEIEPATEPQGKETPPMRMLSCWYPVLKNLINSTFVVPQCLTRLPQEAVSLSIEN